MIGWTGLALVVIAIALITYATRKEGTPGTGNGGTVPGLIGLVSGVVGLGFLFVQAMI